MDLSFALRSPESAAHLIEKRDAAGDGGMARQEIRYPAFAVIDLSSERIDEEEVGGAPAGAVKGHGGVPDPLQGLGQAVRIARELHRRRVREIFPLARYRHGEKAGDERR